MAQRRRRRAAWILVALTLAGKAWSGEGRIVFSKTPIDPANPQNLTVGFRAGDPIYGLMMPAKTWRQLYGEKARTKAALLLMWTIDGQKKVGGYINVVKPEYIDTQRLVFNIAPAVDKMTAYRDKGVVYGEWRGIKKGPCHFTLELGKLSPGKHIVELWINDWGKQLVYGCFQLDGADYSAYTTLHEQIKTAVTGGRTMPAAKKTDKALEAKMTELLRNAGWPNVLRLVIVDKDWWIDRVSGGNSPVKSRHMAAAAAYKDKDGKCFYRVCTFHQQRLLGGGFGPLELTHQGTPVPIPEANVER